MDNPTYKSERVQERKVSPKLPWVEAQLTDLKTEMKVQELEVLSTQQLAQSLTAFTDVKWTALSPENSARAVLTMQMALAGLGLEPGKIDGLWGTKTSNALRVFQEKYGKTYRGKDTKPLVVDGLPGPNSIHALVAALNKVDTVTTSATSTPATAPNATVAPAAAPNTTATPNATATPASAPVENTTSTIPTSNNEKTAAAQTMTEEEKAAKTYETLRMNFYKTFGVYLDLGDGVDKKVLETVKQTLIEGIVTVREQVGHELWKGANKDLTIKSMDRIDTWKSLQGDGQRVVLVDTQGNVDPKQVENALYMKIVTTYTSYWSNAHYSTERLKEAIPALQLYKQAKANDLLKEVKTAVVLDTKKSNLKSQKNGNGDWRIMFPTHVKSINELVTYLKAAQAEIDAAEKDQ